MWEHRGRLRRAWGRVYLKGSYWTHCWASFNIQLGYNTHTHTVSHTEDWISLFCWWAVRQTPVLHLFYPVLCLSFPRNRTRNDSPRDNTKDAATHLRKSSSGSLSCDSITSQTAALLGSCQKLFHKPRTASSPAESWRSTCYQGGTHRTGLEGWWELCYQGWDVVPEVPRRIVGTSRPDTCVCVCVWVARYTVLTKCTFTSWQLSAHGVPKFKLFNSTHIKKTVSATQTHFLKHKGNFMHSINITISSPRLWQG